MESIHLEVEESTSRLPALEAECLLEASLSSSCSPATVSFRDHPPGGAGCCEPGLSSQPEASMLHPPTPSQASDQPTGRLLRGHGSSAREASYTQVSEVRSSGKLLLSPESEQNSSSKEVWSERVAGDPHACVVSPRHAGQMAAPEGHTFPTMDTSELSDVAHPSGSHDHEPATVATLAPVYTLVDGVSGRNNLVLMPNARPGLQLIIPKNVPTPSGYVTPDLLGSITPSLN